MNTKLITALRSTAHALEAGTFDYNWRSRARRNCGALFCALTGMSAHQLRDRLPSSTDLGVTNGLTWSKTVGSYCTITGIPTHELLKEVMSHGLTHQDIVDLENLSNAKVVERMVRDNRDELFTPVKHGRLFWATLETPEAQREDQQHAAAYMRAWADLLTEDGPMDSPPAASVEHQVETVPQPA